MGEWSEAWWRVPNLREWSGGEGDLVERVRLLYVLMSIIMIVFDSIHHPMDPSQPNLIALCTWASPLRRLCSAVQFSWEFAGVRGHFNFPFWFFNIFLFFHQSFLEFWFPSTTWFSPGSSTSVLHDFGGIGQPDLIFVVFLVIIGQSLHISIVAYVSSGLLSNFPSLLSIVLFPDGTNAAIS